MINMIFLSLYSYNQLPIIYHLRAPYHINILFCEIVFDGEETDGKYRSETTRIDRSHVRTVRTYVRTSFGSLKSFVDISHPDIL